MHHISKNKSRESYPQANAAISALSNRFVMGVGVPEPFTSAVPFVVAAVNVTRRASGLFQVNVVMSITAASADTAAFQLSGGPGTSVGGVAADDWLVEEAANLIVSPLGGAIATWGGWTAALPAGGLTATVSISNVNAVPLPAGPSSIFLTGLSSSPVAITPGGIAASAYELP